MKELLSSKAANSFKEGDFASALAAYKQLGALIGHHLVKANVLICERRLGQSGLQKSYASTPLSDIKVACIVDEFTFHSYEPECKFFQLSPDCAESELTQFNPDLLFVESAWRGKDELWNKKISSLSPELKQVLGWCRNNNVPTVFWNKEDPVHFETFLNTAQQFDFVFTTDIDCIPRYKNKLAHDRVFLLPFGCQPKVHNPIELYERKDAFCFAGAYYARYPERTRDLENYLDELPKHRPIEIYDRNLNKDREVYKDYRYPDKFAPFIVGTLPFSEIDKAYKGYKYSINLNSIKQSQSMFARRAFELLASNTITVSNFSRGIRNFFGDLVLASDSGSQILHRLSQINSLSEEKLRLAALRKVMLEHTYRIRLSYVLNKTLNRPIDSSLPRFLVVAVATSSEDALPILDNYNRQIYEHKKLLLLMPLGTDTRAIDAFGYRDVCCFVSAPQVGEEVIRSSSASSWLAPMVASDYYGPNYLLDLAIATAYSGDDTIGKSEHYMVHDGELERKSIGKAYRKLQQLAMRSSAVRISSLPPTFFADRKWLQYLECNSWPHMGLSIDPFNYAKDGRLMDQASLAACVNDACINSGISWSDLVEISEALPAMGDQNDEQGLSWSAKHIFDLVPISKADIDARLDGSSLCLSSKLSDDTHIYLYASSVLPISSLAPSQPLNSFMDATPGLDLSYVFVFLDSGHQKIKAEVLPVNRNHSTTIPDNAAFLRFGWRVRGNGSCIVNGLQWQHRQLCAHPIITQGKYLLITNQYPSHQEIYRYGFVHTRVVAYAEQGFKVDVFRLSGDNVVSYHEFEGVDCVTGSSALLAKLLEEEKYEAVLVHFLDPVIWKALRDYVDRLKIVVWIHGAEIQPWWRRSFNYTTNQQRALAMQASHKRLAFWRSLLNPLPTNLRFVFVSQYFAGEVSEDLGVVIPASQYRVIHNPIDDNLFAWHEKAVGQRKKILTIRPFASRMYAHDQIVKAILSLSRFHFFGELQFTIIGDGPLFEEETLPLRGFRNVMFEQRFLTRAEIAAIHRDHGIFLCPTRWDSHGVSRDEAMSSGLVPVTTRVAAIPEFVDEHCGYLAEPEDVDGLVNAIVELWGNPDIFSAKSRAAAARVRLQSSQSAMIAAELELINSVVE